MTHRHAKDFDDREKKYILVEFPYPSGSGLHIGHAFTFTGADVYARFERMQGKNVLFPIGWDAFGLPTENYAIKTGRKPQDVTAENTATFLRQMKQLGLSFDYERVVDTTDPNYYKWTQWIFIKLYEKGLAYKKEMPINWCPSCKVGLANEEVVNGNCERCGSPTTRRRISQWVVKITEYADKLIDGLDKTEFIDKVKASQVNWIGRSEGARVLFDLKGVNEQLEVFTTRPDTLWGCTFMVLAPEHPFVEKYCQDQPGVKEYVESSRGKSDLERQEVSREKTGVFSGLTAINPTNGKEIPVWISDFVLLSYGTGAIMSVPSGDQRDWDFATKFGLEILPIVEPPDGWDYTKAAYPDKAGVMVNSGPINGLEVTDAIPAALNWLKERNIGEATVSFHLRDWIFSRQHYWGEPIPMVNCEDCGWVPVNFEDLPVVLPEVEKYEPTDTGESPLANITEWVETTCPHCGKPAKRETDTMPNWAGSDWYFVRYVDPHNDQVLADMEKLKYWMPVDLYIGGDEHNTLHLLYSRFVYQFLHDIGAVPESTPEPYYRRMSHGVILGPDNQRMSKSRGNVIVPEDIIKQYGVDAARCYMMFIGPFDATMAWNERALQGTKRFLDRFERLVDDQVNTKAETPNEIKALIHKAVDKCQNDFANFKYNTAVAKLMETLNGIYEHGGPVNPKDLRMLIQAIAPLAPFFAEEAWIKLGGQGNVHASDWPAVDPALIKEDTVEIPVQVNGKLRGTVTVDRNADQATVEALAREVESVEKYLSEGEVRKVIFIPAKTINFVVK
jgi:leucyl-tRNA synthetase